MMRFLIAKHTLHPGEDVVEIWCGRTYIASLYGLDDECGIKLVSEYLPNLLHPVTAVITDESTLPFLSLMPTEGFPPALEVRFRSEKGRPIT